MKWRIPRLKELYKEKLCKIGQAYSKIKPGSRIFISTGCAEPQYLTANLENYPASIADTEILHLVSLGESPYLKSTCKDMCRLNTFFIGHSAREAVKRGDADYAPMFLSEIPKLMKSGRIRVDVAFIQVSPPDPFGNCSLGVSVEASKAAVDCANYVVAQVNKNMPRTLGDSFVNVEQLDAIVEYDEPILEYVADPPDDVSRRIGFYVSRLVPNGSTIQVGIGSIPNAVLENLKDKRDLGVHTEMFSEGLVDLYEAGVINNRKKSFHNGKIIAAFCIGQKGLFDTIDNNPVFEFYPFDYVSDPRNIAKNDDMVAINSALEIDITGQVCSDSIGPEFYSGIGGQADFVRGSALAHNGRPIIAIASTAKDGQISRITPMLTQGSGVVTTRGDVHYVVTEYGIAYLHGKSIRERAMAMINIAHPKFRRYLLEEAKKLNYIYPDQELPPEDGSLYPEFYSWNYKTHDNIEVNIRPIKPIDEEKLRRFFYGLREEDIFYRFMGAVQTMPHTKAQPLVVLDYEEKFAIAAYLGTDEKDGQEEFVGVARWFLDRATNKAEVAFTVSPHMQGRGIGTYLLQRLIDVAKEKGISGFTAEVLAANRKMLSVFYKSGYKVKSQLDSGIYDIEFNFNDVMEVL